MGHTLNSGRFVLERRMAEAARGNPQAYLELGMVYSAGASGVGVDLVEAHKWFNLAALGGSHRGQECRAEIAGEMTAREISEAQKQARAWLSATTRQAA